MSSSEKSRLPIGVFDSGLGGLTAMSELHRLMPNEDIIYFGDSARIPYGTKSPSVIRKFALQDARFLLSKGVKAILVACGTVSSNCIDDVQKETGLPVVGVIDAAAKDASEVAKKGKRRVAVLGTSATIKSGAFETALKNENIDDIIPVACPMFVPLVENWNPSADDTATNAIISEYLSPVAEKEPDSAILGCTHYPLLSDAIQKHLKNTTLISSGASAAKALKTEIERLGLSNASGGKIEYYTSDDPELFRRNAEKFLDGGLDGEVGHIDIEKY